MSTACAFKQTHSSNDANESSMRTIPYDEPFWSAKPTEPYKLEILKNGVLLDSIDLSSCAFTVFGKMNNCGYVLDNPSVSRYHAVIQYRSIAGDGQDVGMYIYDLGSTNGTFLNKKKIEAHTYFRLRVGYCLKFGTSSRMFILQGPEHDVDDENDITHEQMKAVHAKFKRIVKKLHERRVEEDSLLLNTCVNIDWGITEDISSDADIIQNCIKGETLTEDTESNAFYLSDPKAALKSYFEREGMEMNFEYEEVGFKRIKCKISLPIDDNLGNPVSVEVEHVGRKKEAAALCALEACKLLDQAHVLREVIPKYVAVKRNWEANDYYNSDEDTFTDRTGEIERKRQKRMARCGRKNLEEVNTFDSLKKRLTDVIEEELSINIRLLSAKSAERALNADDVDSYVRSLLNGALDSRERFKLKRRLVEIREEKKHFSRLIEIAAGTKSELSEWKESLKQLTDSCENKLKLAEAQCSEVISDSHNEVLEEKKEEIKEEQYANSEQARATISEDIENLDANKDVCTLNSEENHNTSDGKDALQARVEKSSTNNLPKDPNEKEEKPVGTKTYALPRHMKTSKNQEVTISEDYIDWQPPLGQTGDGRTALNDKYGY